MKLDREQLQELYAEMLESESIKKEAELYCANEDAGDRC